MQTLSYEEQIKAERESMSDQELSRQIEIHGDLVESFLRDLKRYRLEHKLLLGELSRRAGSVAVCMCGSTYIALRSDRKFCSAACRQRNYQQKLKLMSAVLSQDPEIDAAMKEQGMRGLLSP